MANQPKKYKKFVATAATATLVASAIVPVASAAGFTDVAGSSHAEAINALADAGIINGYADGTFKPNQTINRGQVVKLLGRWLETEGYEAPADWATKQYFNDLPLTAEKELLKYAALTKEAGVFAGSNGNLNYTQSMQRQQMAVVLVRAINEIYDLDLVAEYKAEKFKSEISDLDKAFSAEQREAITALDYAELTDAAKQANKAFNPANSITRGQFASFLYRTINLDVETGVDASVKAINSTTVEVTFEDTVDVDNVKAENFKIEGLEVKSAAIKQTNKKVVVLTTAAQTADKEYTVSYKDEVIGKFKGIASVIPTSVKMITPSVQGTIGKEATVKAQVTVPEGQSKAGIPVTFNIANDTNNQLNPKIEVVAYTNEEGIASYSYTRYYKYNDQVTAYASEKSSVYASGKVYWAEGLTITEVTTGNDLANGSKKVYKIKTDAYNTQYVGNSNTVDYKYVNVAFAENVDVSPDKLVRDVKVIDTGVVGNADYPSQVTTGGVNVVKVKVNNDGEATFTLTGSNASVTPIVFVDDTKEKNGKYTATALQASAPVVKFSLNHSLGLAVKAEGVQNAAATNLANANNKGTGEGGRDYTVTVTDKDGKVAPAGTKAYVTFEKGNYSTDKTVTIVSEDGKRKAAANKDTYFEIEVKGTKGEASFTLIGQRDAYAAPTVFLENGKEKGLDKDDLQTKGETTYFVDAVIANATLKVLNENDKEVTTLPTTQTAKFEYQSVDQNGFDYYAGNGVYEVAYQVTAQFADVVANGTTVKAGTTETIKVNSVNGKATLNVKSNNVASNVSVQASASQVSLPNKTATLAFTKGTQVPDVYTGVVSKINTVDNKLTFVGYDEIKYSTTSFKNKQGVVISEAEFEKQVSDALAKGDTVKLTSVKNADGNYTLEIADIIPVVVGTKTLDTVVVSEDLTKLTLTFGENVLASSIELADFTLTGATGVSVASVSGNKVVLNVSDVVAGTAPTVAVDANKFGWVDGTANAAIAAVTATFTNVSKVTPLSVDVKNTKAVTEVVAKGKAPISGEEYTATVTAGQDQAAYNGLSIKFVLDGVKDDAPTAIYDLTTNAITVTLGRDNAENTVAKINTAINAIKAQGAIDFAEITLAGTANVDSSKLDANSLIKLANGVTGTSAAYGKYSFTISTNFVKGDTVTFNDKNYVAGQDFLIGDTTTDTAANLATELAKDKRFSGVTNTGAKITAVDAEFTGAAAPTFKVTNK